MNRELLLQNQRIAFRLDATEQGVRLSTESGEHDLGVTELAPGRLVIQNARGQWPARVARHRDRVYVWLAGRTYEFQIPSAEQEGGGHGKVSLDDVRAPMPGSLRKVLVTVGDLVEEGQVVAVLEAMKMEHQLRAPRAGRIGSIPPEVGSIIDADAVVLTLSPGE